MNELEQLQRELARYLVVSSTVPDVNNPRGTPVAMTQLPSDATEQPDNNMLGPLCGIDRRELEQARQTLFRKRRAQTKYLLPQTVRVLDDRYSPWFEVYAVQCHYSGYRAPLLDAIGFSAWLSACAEAPEWLQELARWEAWPLNQTVSPRALRWLALRWHVYQPALVNWETPPRRQRSLWLAYRIQRHFRIFRII